jgi:hypothetical protein
VRRNLGLPRPQQPSSGERDDAAELVDAFLDGLASARDPKVMDVIKRTVASSAASRTARSQHLSAGKDVMAHELVEKAWEAHGGLDRWKCFDMVHATIVSGGQLWDMKHTAQGPTPRAMRVATQYAWASVTPYGAPDQHTDFTPHEDCHRTLRRDRGERASPSCSTR